MGNPQKSGRENDVEKSTGSGESLKSPGLRKSGHGSGVSPREGDWQGPLSASDAAGYVHDMAIELKVLAKSAKLSFLAYLLALVIEESAVQKRGGL